MKTFIIVAQDPKGVIGKDGKLPWRISEDLKFFRQTTMGCPVIMGRKTWDSLPHKPLNGRPNIVISKKNWYPPDDVVLGPHFFDSLIKAIDFVRKEWSGILEEYSKQDIYIIGGSSIYKESLDVNCVDEIIMTQIEENYDGDTYFPDLKNEWEKISVVQRKAFQIIRWRKRDSYDSAD